MINIRRMHKNKLPKQFFRRDKNRHSQTFNDVKSLAKKTFTFSSENMTKITPLEWIVPSTLNS
jgi:hypothetical protein